MKGIWLEILRFAQNDRYSVILSEAKNLTKHSFETLHFVQGEIVDFVNNLIYLINYDR